MAERQYRVIMAQPSPLSALRTANEVAVVIEAALGWTSFLNAKGWDRRKSSASHCHHQELPRMIAFCCSRAHCANVGARGAWLIEERLKVGSELVFGRDNPQVFSERLPRIMGDRKVGGKISRAYKAAAWLIKAE